MASGWNSIRHDSTKLKNQPLTAQTLKQDADMLSYLYRIAHEFERHHGASPNLLYLGYHHFDQLRDALPDLDSTAILKSLDMELILQRDIPHPRVAWSPLSTKAV